MVFVIHITFPWKSLGIFSFLILAFQFLIQLQADMRISFQIVAVFGPIIWLFLVLSPIWLFLVLSPIFCDCPSLCIYYATVCY